MFTLAAVALVVWLMASVAAVAASISAIWTASRESNQLGGPASRTENLVTALKTGIGHDIGLHAPISTRQAWALSRACYAARVGWGGVAFGARKCGRNDESDVEVAVHRLITGTICALI